jgi:hypothetical protein
MIAENKTFTDKVIYLDGCSFVKCTFIRCNIVYSGTMGVHLEGPNFVECKYHLKGAAQETVQFLTGLYKAGGKELVENTFATIRGQRETQALN